MIADEIVDYSDDSFPSGGKAYARARIYAGPTGRVALISEMFLNPGPSVTNAVEAVVAAVQKRFGYDLTIVEHYPREDGSRGEEETFTLVKIDDAGRPKWKYLARAAVAEMLGEEPAPHTRADEPAWLQLADAPVPRDPREVAVAEASAAADWAETKSWLFSFEKRPEVTYFGCYDPKGRARIVVVGPPGAILLPHHVRHSPTGFNWSYGGSGPSEAARCILAHALCVDPGPDGEIPRVDGGAADEFKRDVIASLPRAGWEMPLRFVHAWCKEHNVALR